MNQELLNKIEGGNRWTKGKYDRLYFNDYDLGVKVDYYKTGNISSVEVMEWPYLEGADMEAVNSKVGEQTNGWGRSNLGGKHYIDLDTGEIYSFGFFEARINYLVIKAKKALEAEGKDPDAPEPEMTLAEFKNFIVEATIKNFYSGLAKSMMQSKAYKKNIVSIKKSEDGRYTLTELEIIDPISKSRLEEGNPTCFSYWRIVVDMKRKTIYLNQKLRKRMPENVFKPIDMWLEGNREFKNFEDSHIWTEWTEEPEAPKPTTPKKGAKKMTEAEAVSALTEAQTAEAVQDVLKKTKKAVLMRLARAVESTIGTHVKSNAGRSTLEKILTENAEKLINIDWYGVIKNLEHSRQVREWTVTRIVAEINSGWENLCILTKKQLVMLGNEFYHIVLKNSQTKEQMIRKMTETQNTVAVA